jgi:hypothetical protein
MEEKIIGILKTVSELYVATLVKETDTTISIKDVAFLGISGQNGQVNINFIPIEMLSLDPPVNVRSLLANPTQDITFEIEKLSVWKWDLEMNAKAIEHYRQLLNKPADKAKSVKPEDNIVTLF